MTNTSSDSRSCHICMSESDLSTKDVRGSNICGGCEKRFCNRHYKDHRADLGQLFQTLTFEHDVLLEQLNSFTSMECTTSPLIEEVNRWELETIAKVQQTAATARESLSRTIHESHTAVKSQFNTFTDELRSKQATEDYDEIDVEEVRSKLDDLQKKVKSLSDASVMVKVDYQSVDWETIVSIVRANKTTSLALPVDAKPYFVGTTVLSLDQQTILNLFYGTPDQHWKLLYQGSRDGFTPQDFHDRCDEVAPTVTIYQERQSGYLFGGFTTIPWLKSHSTTSETTDSHAFLFTLSNPHGLPATKFPVCHVGNPAVYHNENFGPSFGVNNGYSDIYYNRAGVCKVHFPGSYKDTTEQKYGSTLFTGTQTFQLSNIEVFTPS